MLVSNPALSQIFVIERRWKNIILQFSQQKSITGACIVVQPTSEETLTLRQLAALFRPSKRIFWHPWQAIGHIIWAIPKIIRVACKRQTNDKSVRGRLEQRLR
jgi:hypothetical protein